MELGELQIGGQWTVLLLDLALPDGAGMTIAQALASRRSRPLTIAVTGTATGEEGSALAQTGVKG